MSHLELTLAILVLLLTPGPTNSLMLLAGAERGLSGTLRLIPVELLGYLLTALPLARMGDTVLDGQSQLRTIVTVLASVWVAVLAVKLWRVPGADADCRSVDARGLFITTALNPKALIFGLVLLPSHDRLAGNVALFAGLVVLVALLWVALGAALRGGSVGQPRALLLLRRLASVWLAAVSVVLAVRSVGT
jgi:threonine/homoserine/homoserine lactone efflux protein